MPPEPKPISRSEAGDTLPADPEDSGAPRATSEPAPKADAPSDDKKESYISREEHDKEISRLYARTKKAEGRLKEKGISLEDEPPQPHSPQRHDEIDPMKLVKTVTALRDYSADEIDRIDKFSKGWGMPHEEVTKNPDFQVWLKGKRDADLKAKNVPSPSGSSSATGLPTSRDIGLMSKEDHAKLDREYTAKQRGGRGI